MSRSYMGGVADLPHSNYVECWCDGQAGVGPVQTQSCPGVLTDHRGAPTGPVISVGTAPKTRQFYPPQYSSESQESQARIMSTQTWITKQALMTTDQQQLEASPLAFYCMIFLKKCSHSSKPFFYFCYLLNQNNGGQMTTHL